MPSEVRTLASRGQRTLAVTHDEADSIRRGLSWRTAPPQTAVSGFRGNAPDSPGGLTEAGFNAYVIRHGIPDRVAGIIHHYVCLGLMEAKRAGGATEAVAEQDIEVLRAWVHSDDRLKRPLGDCDVCCL